MTAQEFDNLDDLAMSIAQARLDRASEDVLVTKYELFRSACRDYGVKTEYLDVLDAHDVPGKRVQGATLVLHLIENDGRTRSLPLNLPEESEVIHPEKSIGKLHFNGIIDGERFVVVDFYGDLCWTDDQYLGWYSAPMTISTELPEGSELYHTEHGKGRLLVNRESPNGLRTILVTYKSGKTLWTDPGDEFLLLDEPVLSLMKLSCPMPSDFSEGTVVHKTFGLGKLLFNRTIKSDSPGCSMWGRSVIRSIAIDFGGDVKWMNPAEQYLALIPAEQETAA